MNGAMSQKLNIGEVV